MKLFKTFANDESGAVTVDWVVLTGIVVAFALAVASLSGNISTAVEGIATSIENPTGS